MLIIRKHKSRKTALLAVVFSAAVAYLFLSYVVPAFSKKPALQAVHENHRELALKPAPKEVNYGLPVRLKISAELRQAVINFFWAGFRASSL